MTRNGDIAQRFSVGAHNVSECCALLSLSLDSKADLLVMTHLACAIHGLEEENLYSDDGDDEFLRASTATLVSL